MTRRHKCPNRFTLDIVADGLASARLAGSWELVDHYLEILDNVRHGRPAFGERNVVEELETRREVVTTQRHEAGRIEP